MASMRKTLNSLVVLLIASSINTLVSPSRLKLDFPIKINLLNKRNCLSLFVYIRCKILNGISYSQCLTREYFHLTSLQVRGVAVLAQI